MIKKIFVILLLFGAVTAVLRFIETDFTVPPKNPPAKKCLSGPAPGTDDNGEPLATCTELETINQAYLQDIKPIFAAKCLMCHGVVTRMPLYAKVPPSSFLVKHDIEEAREHLDMSFDFPFVGKPTDVPQDSLEEIIEVVQEGSMPPFIYKIMHWHSGLSVEESKKILDWANAGLKTLND